MKYIYHIIDRRRTLDKQFSVDELDYAMGLLDRMEGRVYIVERMIDGVDIILCIAKTSKELIEFIRTRDAVFYTGSSTNVHAGDDEYYFYINWPTREIPNTETQRVTSETVERYRKAVHAQPVYAVVGPSRMVAKEDLVELKNIDAFNTFVAGLNIAQA